ncbi:MAG: NADP-dependent oxidoreductase [Pseudomonadota bacterium]
MKNRQIVLKRVSEGVPEPGDFELKEVDAGRPEEGKMLCRTTHISLDPYLRGKISGRHMSGTIHPGELMISEAVSEVVESQHPDFKPGDTIAAFSGWQEHPVVDGALARRVDPDLGPVSTTLGILGMPGLTAYAGLLRLGEPKAGDVVVVSAAAGPVGSMVGQIARIHGCDVIGVAGSDDKCAWITEQAGFTACINYKTHSVREELDRLCPDGVDVYFDNVGGDLLQAIMERLALNSRVVLCGLMAQYNTPDQMPPGPNPGFIIKARATVRGMVVYDHEDLRPKFEQDVSSWLRAGDIRYLEDEAHGLENTPEHFCRLMRGENFGKSVVVL